MEEINAEPGPSLPSQSTMVASGKSKTTYPVLIGLKICTSTFQGNFFPRLNQGRSGS